MALNARISETNTARLEQINHTRTVYELWTPNGDHNKKELAKIYQVLSVMLTFLLAVCLSVCQCTNNWLVETIVSY